MKDNDFFRIPTPGDLKRLRKQCGLSQKELARLAGEGFSQSLIARIENGTVNPPLSKVRRLLEVLYRQLELKKEPVAADIMTRNPVTIEEGAMVSRAIEIMAEGGISQVPVVDGNGKIIGTVAESNLIGFITRNGRKGMQEAVSTAMDPPLPSVDESTTIIEIESLLEQNAAILVQSGKKLVGIITKSDLLQFFKNS